MINCWFNHWHFAFAAATAVRQALPMAEWIKIAVVAVVTAVITSQVTLARLDERITASAAAAVAATAASTAQRDLLVKKRDEQITEIKVKIERIEATLAAIQLKLAERKK